jgi:hypothetical protein
MNNLKTEQQDMVTELGVNTHIFIKSEQINISTFYDTLLDRLNLQKKALEENILKKNFNFEYSNRVSTLNDIKEIIEDDIKEIIEVVENKMNNKSFGSTEDEMTECDTINKWLDFILDDMRSGLRDFMKGVNSIRARKQRKRENLTPVDQDWLYNHLKNQ